MTHTRPPQLVQECNASVQSMKRTEELIHLSKKIHFEGKVHTCRWRGGVHQGATLVLSFPRHSRPLPHPPSPPLPCSVLSALLSGA